MTVIFLDRASDFHPYECDGPGKCIHCDRLITHRREDAKWTVDHDPAACALCDPAYDRRANPS